MRFIVDVVGWFTTGDHWQGAGGVPTRMTEHLRLSVVSVLAAGALALPVGLVLGHLRRGGLLAINVSNIGRAIPSFALLVLMVQLVGIGDTPAYVALIALAVPPMVTNTYIGVRDVDPDARDAARGMGMNDLQVLVRVEVPLALPLIVAGVRTSAVQVVATATLAAVVAGGGLGRYIVDGLAQQDQPQLFAGALLVAVTALVTELGLGWLERRVTPGRRRRDRWDTVAGVPATEVHVT